MDKITGNQAEQAVNDHIPGHIPGSPVRVLFVCLGNICRSPAADGVMRAIVKSRGEADRWVIDSAGTGDYHVGDLPDRRMRSHGAKRGYKFDHICRQVRPSDYDDFDLIVAMDANNERHLKLMAPTPEAERKVALMSQWFDPDCPYDYVPDPYYEGAEGFEIALDLIEMACRNLADSL